MGIVVSLRSIRFRSKHERRETPCAATASPPLNALRRRPASRNAPLHCLAGGNLAQHFHKWRGASGKGYICSVFPVLADAELGGLPEFDEAVVLAVARDGDGQRRRIAVLQLSWRDGQFQGDAESIRTALRSGACEWHIHLLAEDEKARRAVIADMA